MFRCSSLSIDRWETRHWTGITHSVERRPKSLAEEAALEVVSGCGRSGPLVERFWDSVFNKTRPGLVNSKTKPLPDFMNWHERPSTARRMRKLMPKS